MKKKKITFSEPNCRFGCPHFKSVGSVLNETCYCMKKGKKGRRLGKKDLKRRPPEWCPRRLKTPVCRIYGFKDEMHEALELDNRLNFEPDKTRLVFSIVPPLPAPERVSTGHDC